MQTEPRMSTAGEGRGTGSGIRRLLAILLFAAGGFATEIVRPVYCSCITESRQRTTREEKRTDV
jgi:hypothetical protein